MMSYDTPELKAARMLFDKMLKPYAPQSPLRGPLAVHMIFSIPPLASDSKANKVKWKATRPDCSNWIKAIEDQMTRLGFWGDDSQITSLLIEKVHNHRFGLYVKIDPLGLDELHTVCSLIELRCLT